ncbi:MAG TPA: beta-1,3-glucanase family protein [Chthoniobacteraceae bacterium]|nr:beta-1,3-glucanase family protein [Chthoniobacteraceae bacterium]
MKTPVKKSLLAAALALAAFVSPTHLRAQAPAPAASGSATSNPGDFYQFVNATGGAFTDDQISYTIDGQTFTMAQAKSHPIVNKPAQRITFKLTNAQGTYSDFIEYTQNASWNGNTSYVDAFALPMTIELFKADGSSQIMGIKESRKALFELFKKQAPPEFQACVDGDRRIGSPRKGDMGDGKPHADYFDKYVDEIWATYATPKTLPDGWTGKVENGALIFSKPGEKDKTLPRKPTTKEILQGSGILGGSPGFCAAFNRHVAADPGDWFDPTKFYQQLPYNFYAKFWHEHTVDGKAYGFCYDDFAGQASYMSSPATKLIITFYWDNPPATQPKAAAK